MFPSHIFNAELNARVGKQRRRHNKRVVDVNLTTTLDVKGTKVNYKNLSGDEYDFKAS